MSSENKENSSKPTLEDFFSIHEKMVTEYKDKKIGSIYEATQFLNHTASLTLAAENLFDILQTDNEKDVEIAAEWINATQKIIEAASTNVWAMPARRNEFFNMLKFNSSSFIDKENGKLLSKPVEVALSKRHLALQD